MVNPAPGLEGPAAGRRRPWIGGEPPPCRYMKLEGLDWFRVVTYLSRSWE
jgi:hypothetical protein